MSTSSNTLTQQTSLSGLRKVLLLDAITCVLMGFLLVGGKGFLSPLLGLPEGFTGWAGWILFPCAALIAFTGYAGSKINPPHALVWLVILGNVGWVAASMLTIAVWFNATALGVVFVLFQAAAVAIMTALEYRGLLK